MRLAASLACTVALLAVVALAPAAQGQDAKAKKTFDYTQKLMPDPNYKGSAEAKYRERKYKEMIELAERAERMAHERTLANTIADAVRYHRRAYRTWSGIPVLNTLFWSGVGAVVGNQSHHAWEGAAAGAAFGALLDGYSYHRRRCYPYDHRRWY